MTGPHAIVRGLGTVAAVLGVLAAAVGAPVRSERSVSSLASAATRDAFDCIRDDGTCGSLDCARDDGKCRSLDCARDDSGPAAPLPRSPAAPHPSSRASEASRGICTSAAGREISALQLAQWIRDGRPGLRVLDLRDSTAFETRHIPSAESFELSGLPTVLAKPSETLVIYSDDDLRDAQGVAWLAAVGHARVHIVRDGLSAWMREVIDPVVQGDSAATVAALSRYFGGVPRAMPANASVVPTPRTSPATRVRNATDEFGFAARRGC